MTRVFRNPPEFVRTDTDVNLDLVLPYLEGDYGDSPREAKENAAYKAGDIFYARTWQRLIVCRVVYVRAEHLRTRGEWIPVFRCQVATKSGKWSSQWRDIYPGYIFRAYHDQKTEEAVDVAALYAAQQSKKPALETA